MYSPTYINIRLYTDNNLDRIVTLFDCICVLGVQVIRLHLIDLCIMKPVTQHFIPITGL